MYTDPDQIQERQPASTEPHICGLIALKLIAGCIKLLASLGKLNMWGFVRGIQFWGNYSSTQGRFLPKRSPLRSAEADHGLRNPGVRRPEN
jgi:hypothetical protein